MSVSRARDRLEVAGLACARGPADLFRDVTFGIEGGEWLSVRGSNGSGKTTLLRCVAGLTRPDQGEIRWNGQPTRESRASFNAGLLYLGHLPGIKDDLTAEENLDQALRLRGRLPTDAAKRSALAELDLDKRRHIPARRLSAGQRRRIGLARLLLDTASCWILDEPLAALDDSGRALFARLLKTHVEGGGMAIVATHEDVGVPAAREWRLS